MKILLKLFQSLSQHNVDIFQLYRVLLLIAQYFERYTLARYCMQLNQKLILSACIPYHLPHVNPTLLINQCIYRVSLVLSAVFIAKWARDFKI
ncbi:hypothetical protein BpHYR1_038169 [Brachionus plicatilis]|uniref:Uncharacterized protein n=1 Tax=Brachionus plicatilis TaxID=10195 RepID=A0A3M7PY54_BRAPC|nr:hypothetical protein BpHYR1_038169 [Brachionus plicatilis]